MPQVDPELMVDKRTTSAGYRLPVTQRPPSSSEYHNKCTPAKVPSRNVVTSTRTNGTDNACSVDVVTEDKIWRQSLHKERNGARQWKDNWGFLADFNDKGELKEPEEMPEKVNMFSDSVPNTNAGNYGHQAQTEAGIQMQQLEFKLCSGNRRRKMGNDLVCY